jgi:hypothetical protein
VHEQVLKGTQYTAAVFSPNGKSYASASDGTLREIQEGQVLRTVDLPASINGCALSRSGKLLLCALGKSSFVLFLDFNAQFQAETKKVPAEVLLASGCHSSLRLQSW